MSKYIDVENIIPLFRDVIDVHDAFYLRERAISFMLKHFAEIYESSSYKELDESFRSTMERRARQANILFGNNKPKPVTYNAPSNNQPTVFYNHNYIKYKKKRGFFNWLFH
jgi:hypothetical protein